MARGILAIIWIGGRLDTSRGDILIDAINNAILFAREGDTYFRPQHLGDLEDALTPSGQLYLCDDSAPMGSMPGITELCRELGLSYRLWHEAHEEAGAEIEVWAPGMEAPLRLTADSGPEVRQALQLLELGKDDDASRVLDALLPEVPPLPRFETNMSSLSAIADEVA